MKSGGSIPTSVNSKAADIQSLAITQNAASLMNSTGPENLTPSWNSLLTKQLKEQAKQLSDTQE